MVAAARERLARFGERVSFVVADLGAPLPIEAASVDAVLSTATFHWVRDHDALFRHLAAVLRPGARLVAQCGGAGNIAAVRAAIAAAGEPWEGPWTFATPDETRRRLEAAGFTAIEAWLHDEPTPVEPGEPLREYLRTVVLGAHLERMPVERRDAFVAAVADGLPAPEIDYVRLNILATRGRAGTQGVATHGQRPGPARDPRAGRLRRRSAQRMSRAVSARIGSAQRTTRAPRGPRGAANGPPGGPFDAGTASPAPRPRSRPRTVDAASRGSGPGPQRAAAPPAPDRSAPDPERPAVARDHDVGRRQHPRAARLDLRLVGRERVHLGRPVLAPPEVRHRVHGVVGLDDQRRVLLGVAGRQPQLRARREPVAVAVVVEPEVVPVAGPEVDDLGVRETARC